MSIEVNKDKQKINEKGKTIYKHNNDKNAKKYDLRGFLSILKDKNELLIIDKKVKRKFQLAAIVGKLDKKEAILFTNIEDSKFKVVSNVLGTRKRFFYDFRTNSESSKIDFSNFANINKESYPAKISSDAPFYKNSSQNLLDLPIITH